MEEGDKFHDRPPLDLVIKKFRAAKYTAYVAGLFFTILFVGVWPGSMLTIDVFNYAQFNTWTVVSRGWAFTAAAFIVLVPMIQEVKAVLKQLKRNKEDKTSMSDEHMPLSKVEVPSRVRLTPWLWGSWRPDGRRSRT